MLIGIVRLEKQNLLILGQRELRPSFASQSISTHSVGAERGGGFATAKMLGKGESKNVIFSAALINQIKRLL